MAKVTAIRIADQKAGKLIATAPEGEYLSAPGHDRQLLANRLKLEPGQALQQKKLYAVAGAGLPASLNFEYLHKAGDEVWVFEEVSA